MSKSIAVFGAGPGLGQAVARRYAREGYAVTLVARRSEPLDRLAKDLTSAEVAEHGVYVGMLYVGAAIENSAFHAEMEKGKAAGDVVWEMPTSTPDISPTCSGLCTVRRDSGKPSIRSIACRACQDGESHHCR